MKYKTKLEIALQEKLNIAVKALEEYANEDNWMYCSNDKLLRYWRTVEKGNKEAEEALAKIKEIK